MINRLLHDVRYATRVLRKTPGFTLIALLTLALGIGANSAMFSVVNAVLLRPLPYPESDSLVKIFNPSESTQVRIGEFSPQDFDDLARESKSYTALSSYEYVSPQTAMNLTGDGEPVRLNTAFVSGQFFNVFQVRPEIGRMLNADDDVVGRNSQVVISESLWRNRFASDPSIAGRKVILGEKPFTIVGVAPVHMQFPDPEVQVWAPVTLLGEDSVPHRRDLRWLNAVGRLKPGVTLDQADAEANVIMGRLAKLYPDSNKGHEKATVKTLREALVGDVRPAIMVLFATVSIVLLIACSNLANLVLARGAGRTRELAIRAALGAGRGRLISQLLTESVLLSLIGGALGLVLATWMVRMVVTLGGSSIPRADSISIDWRVVVVTFALALVSGLLFGIIPALRAAGLDFQHAFKDAGYTVSEGQKRRTVRNALIVGEVAMAAVLLVASILVVKSLWKLMLVDPGFGADNVLSIRIVTPEKYSNDGTYGTTYRLELLRRVSEVPGVLAVGASKTLPLKAGGEPYRFKYAGENGTVDVNPDAGVFIVSPGYFDALGIPLLSGRTFSDDDNRSGASAALIVNQALAQRYWPNESAVGKQLLINKAKLNIIGVVGNVRSEGLTNEPRAAIYGSFMQFPRGSMYIYARTSGNPLAIAGLVRQAIWQYEKNQPLEMMTLSSATEQQMERPKFFTTLLTGFGALALLLAAIGIYGVISYNVHQQFREIGIRMALGAQPGQVLHMVLGSALRLTLIGLAIGTVVALIGSRALRSLLYGVTANDITSYVLMPVMLASVALLASYIPARRATKIDPVIALRYE